MKTCKCLNYFTFAPIYATFYSTFCKKDIFKSDPNSLYQVPPITDVPIIRSVVDALISLHNNGPHFYQILATILLNQKTSSSTTEPWSGLQLALLQFVGLWFVSGSKKLYISTLLNFVDSWKLCIH